MFQISILKSLSLVTCSLWLFFLHSEVSYSVEATVFSLASKKIKATCNCSVFRLLRMYFMEERTIEITMVSVTINLVLGVKGTGHNEHLSEIYFEITDETTLLQTYL